MSELLILSSGLEVTNVTTTKALVGCTKVTRSDVEAVLHAMDKAKASPVMYRIECAYLGGGWCNCVSEELGHTYYLAEATRKVEYGTKEFGDNWKFRVVPV